MDFIKVKWREFPIGVYLILVKCGSQYSGILQKTNEDYGSVLLQGYSGDYPKHIWIANGVWTEYKISGTVVN